MMPDRSTTAFPSDPVHNPVHSHQVHDLRIRDDSFVQAILVMSALNVVLTTILAVLVVLHA